jgi:predicted flap endonuclease-1-like 5' DNA nuclease
MVLMLRQTRSTLAVLILLVLTQLGFSGHSRADGIGTTPEFWLALLVIAVLIGVVAWWVLRRPARPASAGDREAPPTNAAQAATHAVEGAESIVETARSTAERAAAAEVIAAAPAAPTAAEPDDLRRIEGIGPKVSAALVAMGITTFAQLAQADPARLEADLKAAGVRVITGSSTTWPEQAALAARGDWAGLEALQGQLKGGRKKK